MQVLVISDYRNIFVVVNFNLPQPTVQELITGIQKEILNSHNFRKLPRLTFQNDMEKSPFSSTLKKRGDGILRITFLSCPHTSLLTHLCYNSFGNYFCWRENDKFIRTF